MAGGVDVHDRGYRALDQWGARAHAHSVPAACAGVAGSARPARPCEEADIRREIETALAPLVGLPLTAASRVVDMATFGFGAMPAAGTGATGVGAAYRLHIQEIWRITLEGEILVGYGDYFFPPRDSRVARGDFVARDAARTRRDDLVDDWVAHDPDGPHVVAAVRGTRAGDLALTFGDGCVLETFATSVSTAADGSDEFWRLIPPRVTGEERGIVVTAHGVEGQGRGGGAAVSR